MSICGRVHLHPNQVDDVERSAASLSLGPARLIQHRSLSGVRLASADDGALAVARPERAAAFDGRIDNRAVLRDQLGGDGFDQLDNAGVALLAYDKWGDDFCERIIGDYACAVWDGETRRLVMATDPGALRPLFYWLGNQQILFASEQRGLWADPDVPKAIDEEQMALWLALLPRDPHRSVFKDIFRAPPGHRVVWSGGRTSVERWWRPENLATLRLPRNADYAEALRAGLTEAVNCRIATSSPIGAHLSGGLDSGSVTALAARQLAEQGRRLTAFTAVPAARTTDPTGRFVDEWPHAASLAALYPNIDHLAVSNNDSPVLDALALREAAQDWPVLNLSNVVWMDGINRVAQQRGINVMLVGQLGNMTVSYDGGEPLTAQLRQGRMIAASRTAAEQVRHGAPWRQVAGQVARGLLPDRVYGAAQRLRGRRPPSLFDLSTVNPEVIRSVDVETRALSLAGGLRNGISDERALRLAALDRSDHRGHWAAGSRRLFGIDVRDPTADRRVIELCFSMPDEQYRLGGVPRSLVRRAMAGLVPEAMLAERRKGLQAADWRLGFDAARSGIADDVARLRHSDLAARCLDLDRLQALIDAWPDAGRADAATDRAYKMALGRAVAAGRFIRRVEGGNG